VSRRRGSGVCQPGRRYHDCQPYTENPFAFHFLISFLSRFFNLALSIRQKRRGSIGQAAETALDRWTDF
jgi:hypothetical protein